MSKFFLNLFKGPLKVIIQESLTVTRLAIASEIDSQDSLSDEEKAALKQGAEMALSRVEELLNQRL